MCLCILFHFCFVSFVRLAIVAKKTHLPIIQMDAITVLSTYISTCAWHTPKWLIDFIRDTMNWCKWQHPLIWAQKMTAHDLNWKPVKHKRSARVCDATTMATTAGPDLLACIMKWWRWRQRPHHMPRYAPIVVQMYACDEVQQKRTVGYKSEQESKINAHSHNTANISAMQIWTTKRSQINGTHTHTLSQWILRAQSEKNWWHRKDHESKS